MILRFVEGGAWDSKVIQYSTRCRWSHVEALGPDGTFGAMLKGGVRWRKLYDASYRGALHVEVQEIACSAFAEAEFWQFLQEQNGKPYDWRAILSFGLGERDWREEDSWFCSELLCRALEVAGLLELPGDIPVSRITPRDLWILVAGLKHGVASLPA